MPCASISLSDANPHRDAFMSRTMKHSGAIKSLQFNPFKSELLATAGAKGEVGSFLLIHPFHTGD
jgi:hypothetical protein